MRFAPSIIVMPNVSRCMLMNSSPSALLVLLLALISLTGNRAWGQVSIGGVISSEPWPTELSVSLDSLPFVAPTTPLLVGIDSISLSYEAYVLDSTDQDAAIPPVEMDSTGLWPEIAFGLSWSMGPTAVLDSSWVRSDDLPGLPVLTSIALSAQVWVGDDHVDDLVLSLALPDLASVAVDTTAYAFETAALSYANIFAGRDARVARLAFDRGFRLDSLTVLSAGVALVAVDSVASRSSGSLKPGSKDTSRTSLASKNSAPGAGVERDRTVYIRETVYVDRPDLITFWGIQPVYPWYSPIVYERYEPRGRAISRSSSGDPVYVRRRSLDNDTVLSDGDVRSTGLSEGDASESAESGRSVGREWIDRFAEEDGDEDDRDREFGNQALMTAAVVGMVAYAGGTIGVYGNAVHTPIGFISGYVRKAGGLMLHASINAAVIEAQDRERMAAGILGFKSVGNLPEVIQPAVGLGVLQRESGDDITMGMTFQLGVVANFGRPLVILTYDLAEGGIGLGFAYNFRTDRDE